MYPVAYSVKHEEEGRNRLTVFFRLILAIPWIIWGSLWGIAVFFTVVGAWFALLVTGRYPQGLYDFNVSYLRFMARVHSWVWLFVDEWPSFNGSPDPNYPARLKVDPPLEEYNRVKVFFRLILLIPVYILTYIMSLILELIAIVAWFVLVFAAKLPEGLYKPMRASNAYLIKAGAYAMLITESFPPFWEDEADEAPAFAEEAPAAAAPPPPPPPATA